jgi:hypothetical protein
MNAALLKSAVAAFSGAWNAKMVEGLLFVFE